MKNGYLHLNSKSNHYKIFEKFYDALVFIKYVNGGEKPYNQVMDRIKQAINIINFPRHFYNLSKFVFYKLSMH